MRGRLALVLVSCLLWCSCLSEEEDPDIEQLQQVGAEYLQNVMNQLQSERAEGQPVEVSELTNLLTIASEPPVRVTSPPRYAITAPTPLPPLEADIVPVGAPPPSLTSDQLTAIYQAAVTKGHSLQGSSSRPVSTLHHPPPPAHAAPIKNQQAVVPSLQGAAGGGANPGYYYYFYPIKSFLKTPEPTSPPPSTTVAPMPMQAHFTMMETPNRGMEPLFMAISGFIGMALMFVFSVLFLPKFGKFRSGDLSELKEAPDDLATIGRLVIATLDGKDCTERIACEVGRLVRKFKLGTKPLRILEILLPPPMNKQITQVRKAAARKEKCAFVECKVKTARPPARINPPKPQPASGESWH